MAEVVEVSAVTGRYPVQEIGNIPSVRVNRIVVAGLQIPPHDRIELSYSAGNLTGVIYRMGGVAGGIVAELVLTYSGSDLSSVTRVL